MAVYDENKWKVEEERRRIFRLSGFVISAVLHSGTGRRTGVYKVVDVTELFIYSSVPPTSGGQYAFRDICRCVRRKGESYATSGYRQNGGVRKGV
ncbi:MAG: hypothetical protein LBR10_09700 [Prevotellaceae bacterium]|jgi:hypothetical protein|nr:hypothetical protein [Prevotellaceae bacterium]